MTSNTRIVLKRQFWLQALLTLDLIILMGENLDHMGYIHVRFSSNAWFGLDIQFKYFFRLECSVCYNVWISLKIQFGWKMLGSDWFKYLVWFECTVWLEYMVQFESGIWTCLHWLTLF